MLLAKVFMYLNFKLDFTVLEGAECFSFTVYYHIRRRKGF
jgi:hypothetical protein